MDLNGLNAPPDVAEALRKLTDELKAAAGPNLLGLILYGGLVRGRYRPGRSDINVVLYLDDASGKGLAPIAPVLRAAFRSSRVEPFILARAEIGRVAIAFPTKFHDIRQHHRVLFGEDPFAALVVSPEHIRLRVEQELRNHAIRMRRRLIAVGEDAIASMAVLSNLAVPLAIDLAALVELAGKAPDDDTPGAVFECASRAFELDRDALASLALLKKEGGTTADMRPLYDRLLAVVSRAADVAANMGPKA